MSGHQDHLTAIRWKFTGILNKFWTKLRVRAPILKNIFTVFLTTLIIGGITFTILFFSILVYFTFSY